MKVTWILAWKDLKLFASDRKAMIITFAVPIFIASFMGSLFSNGGSSGSPIKKVPILIVDEDHSQVAKSIIKKLSEGDFVKPSLSTMAKAEKAVRTGSSGVAIVLPRGFGNAAVSAMGKGIPPHMKILYDPSAEFNMQFAKQAFMQAAMKAIASSAFGGSGNVDPKPPFELDASPLTNEVEGNWSGSAHMFAGMGVQGVLFFGIEAAMGLLKDRRMGIWKRLRASPITSMNLILGKLLGSSLISALILFGIFGFGALVFHLRISGSYLGFELLLLTTAFMTACFGLFVAALGRTEQQSRGFAVMAVLLMSMLGGAWFPSFLMPNWMQTASLLVPVRYAVDGFDAMTWRGLGLDAALVPLAGLLTFSFVFAAIAFWRMETTPEA